MGDSILNSIKKLLGIDPAYTVFDSDLVIHINSVFAILTQLGAGPIFSITGSTETWSSYVTSGMNLELVKTYMYMKVKQVFDPPTIGVVNESLNNMIKEYEWRINVAAETPEVEVNG